MTALLDHFHEAITTVEDVEKLKKYILQLAMQGKLVEQDPDDEPASELLKRIEKEKDQLIKEKKIKKQKPLPPITEEEKPYELPQGWEWVRFGDLTVNRDGERVPLSKSIREKRKGNYDYYGASGVIDKIDDYLFDKPLLLIGEDGANLINRSTPIAFIAKGKYWVNNHAHVIDAYDFSILQYLVVFINGISLEPYITGTAQPKMNQAKLNSIPIAVPPLKEQKLIAEKVDELFKQCYELKTDIVKKQTQSKLLNTSVFTRLQDHNNPSQMNDLSFVVNNIEHLCNDKTSIDQLRNSLLSLAVQGKLVGQDPNDEPASVLLEKIKDEKDRLIKEKKIKKEKPLPPIAAEEVPYELPKGWEWVRLGAISHNIHYGYTASALDIDTGVKLLRITDIQNNRVNWSKVPYCEIEANKLEGTMLKNNDILIARTGGTIGKSFIVNNVDEIAVFASYLIRVITSNFVSASYIKLFLETNLYWEQLKAMSQGTGQPNVNATSLSNLLVPLAPKYEQEKIVEKINQYNITIDNVNTNVKILEEKSKLLLSSLI